MKYEMKWEEEKTNWGIISMWVLLNWDIELEVGENREFSLGQLENDGCGFKGSGDMGMYIGGSEELIYDTM